MSKVYFKPGDTLDWPGQVVLDGVTDFTGYTLKSQIRKKNKTSGAQPTPDMTDDGLLAEVDVSWLDATQGLFRARVSRADTADWPINDVAFIDVSVISSTDEVVTTLTQMFDLLPRSTKVP